MCIEANAVLIAVITSSTTAITIRIASVSVFFACTCVLQNWDELCEESYELRLLIILGTLASLLFTLRIV